MVKKLTGNAMILSMDQSAALTDINKLLSDTGIREHVLTGSPGTGKSHLTTQVIVNAENAGYQVVLTATTHQATKVMADFTQREVLTMHKLFDLKIINNYVTGEISTDRSVGRHGPMIEQQANTNQPILLVIDEASFINAPLYSYIPEFLETYSNIVVLYVGDADQLPPIGTPIPHVFNINLPTSILTTDHRFSSTSQMAQVVQKLKANIQDKSYFLTEIVSGKEITVLDEDDFKDKMFELYNTVDYQLDPYFVKTMAYRNTVVNNMNNHIRNYFYDNPSYQIGERLIVNTALKRKTKMLAHNSDVVTVLDNTSTIYEGLKCQHLTLQNGKKKPFKAYYTVQKQKKNAYRKTLIENREWKKLYTFIDSFIEVKEPYSSTIHKAQGASYTNVMLHLDDLVACDDLEILARLLLVAVSRAREHVYVYGGVPANLLRKAG